MSPDTNLMNEWPALLGHLMRGGGWGYWWSDRRDDLGRARSRWWPTNQPAPLPGISESVGNWYFGVNPTTARGGEYQRAKAPSVAAVNAVFADFDIKVFGDRATTLNWINELKVPPTALVDSGMGYHAYWCFREPFRIGTDADREWIAALLRRWVSYTGGDPACSDLPRILRVPGTMNRKYDPPLAVRLVRVRWDLLYSALELEAALPAVVQTPARAAIAGTGDVYDRAMHPRHSTGDTLAWAESLLQKVDPARADSYSDWVTVGMALQDLGDAGLQLWEQWSSQSGKYKPNDCQSKWGSFARNGVSLGTLWHLAQQDGR